MGIYPDDPDGPETFEEALEAFRASLRDLWHVAGVPVAQAAADRLQAGVETWRAWWKPMDLSGPWTAGWTPEAKLLAEIWKEIWAGIREAFMGKGPGPELRGIQGLRPDLTILDEEANFRTNTIRMGVDLPDGMTFAQYVDAHQIRPRYGIISTGLTPDQMARHRAEIPFPQAETNRAFQDVTTGEWMVDDGEDAIDEEAREMIRTNLRRGMDRHPFAIGLDIIEDPTMPPGSFGLIRDWAAQVRERMDRELGIEDDE